MPYDFVIDLNKKPALGQCLIITNDLRVIQSETGWIRQHKNNWNITELLCNFCSTNGPMEMNNSFDLMSFA